MGKNKYNFKEREEHWRKFWADNEIYKFDEKSDKPVYAVDTPPPYVSAAHLHAGHIMSYSQAEFVVRYRRMKGEEVFYPMGFDDNGLPTERFVEKKYKINKDSISRSEFIDKCLEETKIGAQTYKDLWSLLGISVDWTKTYSTINPHCQKISQWSFIDLFKKGKLTRKDDPVAWCPACQTALAQADIEDSEEKGKLNYINFIGEGGKDLLIVTTRPELIPACVALFVNPEDKRYKDLIGKKATVPLFGLEVPIMSDETVDPEFGTGLMMVCTWGDGEDVKKWKNHGLEERAVFEPNGRLNEKAGEFAGLKIKQAREKILEKLKQEGFLVKQEDTDQVVPVHERCDTPVEFVKTKQWFIDVLSAKNELLAQGEEMNWYPTSMKQKYIDWVSSLKWDWCISRQRYYGVPFPVWHCGDCGEIILPDEKDLPVDPMEDKAPVASCPKCQSNNIEPEKDVMDTWMTSSLTPVIGSRLIEDKVMQEKLLPASLRPQAFEIIRTWLFYTTVKSYYHFNDIPFKDIMISGHGLDSKGQKISKRLGNYIDPVKIIDQYSADALRYWATKATLGGNLRYSEEEVRKGSRTVVKLFNASKFALSHLGEEDYTKLDEKELKAEDKWILDKLNETIKKATDGFEGYEYSRARTSIDEFFWQDFCDNYLEFVKNRLYADEPDEAAKKVLYYVLLRILKLYAPIIPYITEEIYQMYFAKFEGDKSIHISSWPKVNEKLDFTEKEKNQFEKAVEVVEEIRKFKTENQMSLGAELDDFKTQIKFNKQFEGFIQAVGRVKKIK